jgi:AbrB family looped-hinge helix DNA binding protein
MKAATTKVADGGRVVIPAEMRKAMGLQVGERVEIVQKGDSLTITRYNPLARAHAIAAKVMGKKYGHTHVVEEFLSERRAEAKREAGE